MSGPKGTTNHPMDLKGRVTFPAKYHRELDDNLVLVKSIDSDYPSLSIYASDEYDRWVERFFESRGGFNERSKKDLAMKVRLYRSCADVKVDQAGRILIPSNLREYASLEKTVSIVGVQDFVQIWNPDILEDYMSAYEDDDILDLP